MSVSLTNTSVVNASYDWIGLYQFNADNTPFLPWECRSVGAGSVLSRYLPMNGCADIARASFAVIGATTSPVPTPALTSVTLLVAQPGVLQVGGTVTATFSTSGPINTSDLIGLYKASDGDAQYLALSSVGTAVNGTLSINAPTVAGNYDLRYLARDPSSINTYYIAARSNIFSVVTSVPTPTPTPTSTPTPTPSPTLSSLAPILVAQPSSVQTGSDMPVSLSGIWRSTGDYVALYEASAPDAQYLDFKVAAASMSFTAPATQGNYNFRYLARDEGGNYYVAGTSNIVTVSSTPPTATPTATPASTPIPTPTPTPTPTQTLASGASSQCTLYVAPNGSSSGNGSFSSPWSLTTIAGGVPEFDGNPPPPAVIQPGDTICLRGGTYVPAPGLTVFFRTTLAGTAGHQITIQPYPGEHVIIDPQAPAGGDAKNHIFILEGPYVTIRDLEITDSYAMNRTDGRPGGIQVAQGATGAKVINNVVHDTGDGIDKNDLAADVEFYGNVIYNVGWDDRLNGLQQGGTGHGMYASNDSGSFRVYNNIIAASFGFGFHFYSAGVGHLNNFDVQDNVSLNNGYWTRYHDSSYATEGRGTDNYLIGHRPVVGMNFTRNFGYHREQRGAQNIELGYTGVENVSGSATANVLVGGVNDIQFFPTLTFTGNYISSNFHEILGWTPSAEPVSVAINNNTYFFYPSDCSALPFAYSGVDKSVAQWRALGFDANSTINACGVRDVTPTVTIKPNAYDANRFHVIVNNPAIGTIVTLNLSSALTSGDRFELRNAQDYYGTLVASGTYNGPISVNMATLNVATPIGYGMLSNVTPLAMMTTGPQFGVFILTRK
jgi:hypothetical protein